MKFDVLENRYNSIRNVMYATRGAVATSNPIAAQAGLDIMKKGGNAIDAAVATAAALTVVEPTSNGIGGDAFSLVWIESEKKLYGLNSSGFAPERMKTENYKDMKEMPKYGFKAVTVPGIPASWAELNKKFGNLNLSDCVEQAADYAENGFIVYPNVAKIWNSSFKTYSENLKSEEFKEWFNTFTINGKAPKAGEVFKCKDQAESLREIGRTNAESFYRGNIAEKIDKYSRKYNGELRKSDLEKFYPTWVEPIKTDYKGYTVCEIPPNGHGITVLNALNIMENMEIKENRDCDENIHKMIESMKIAFADSKKYVTDADKMRGDFKDILNKDYAKERSKLIGDKAVLPEAGDPFCGGTVYLCTADSEGNIVSHIQSNYMDFGSGIVIPDTGIALHNRGNNFSTDINHDNCVEPFKKPYHTIIPGFLMKDNEALGAFGVMGAFMQPQGQFQVLTNMIDYKMNPQEALDAPRWQWIDALKIEVESDMSENVVKGLIARGHDVKVVEDKITMGRGQIILKNNSSGYICATEKRCDGHVAVW